MWNFLVIMLLICSRFAERLSYRFNPVLISGQSRGWQRYLRKSRLQSDQAGSFSTKKGQLTAFLPDLKRRLNEFESSVNSILATKLIDLNALKGVVKDLEEESSQESFWEDQDRAQSVLGELNRARDMVNRVEEWIRGKEDVSTYLELYDLENDGECANCFPITSLSHSLTFRITPRRRRTENAEIRKGF